MTTNSGLSYTGIPGRSERFDVLNNYTSYVNAGDGSDFIFGYNQDDYLIGGVGRDFIRGANGNDIIFGDQSSVDETVNVDQNLAAGADLLLGENGNDTIFAGGGNNFANGGAGNDNIFGGAGNEFLVGGLGNDLIYGYGGDDVIYGGTASAATHSDFITTNFGSITYSFNGIDDTVQPGTVVGSGYGSFDIALTNTGNDYLDGGDGNDTIYGQDGDDTLMGGNGNDNLNGGTGADILNGGDGTDFARYDDAGAGVVANLGKSSSNTGDAAGDTYVSIEGLYGSGFGDLLTGDSNANIIYGQGGGDNLLGGAGDDALYGGEGDDNLYGGAGADYLAGDNGFDAARYDTASAGVTAVLINSGMNAGDAAGDRYFSIEALVGSNFNDNLIGDNGDNLISGGAGNDAITGYAGNDTIYGGAGSDLFFYQANSGSDMIMDFAPTSTAAVHDTLFLASNLNGSGITDFNSAMAHATNSGSNVVFDLGGGNNLALQGVQKSQLSASDFAFG